jgi:hypothetical protein
MVKNNSILKALSQPNFINICEQFVHNMEEKHMFYCRKPNGVLVNLDSVGYRRCSGAKLSGASICGGWRYFLSNCPKTNTLCSATSGAWVAAITVCNQQLF